MPIAPTLPSGATRTRGIERFRAPPINCCGSSQPYGTSRRPCLARRRPARAESTIPQAHVCRAGRARRPGRCPGLWAVLPRTSGARHLSESVAIAQMLIEHRGLRSTKTGIGQRSIRTLQDGSSVELTPRHDPSRVHRAHPQRRIDLRTGAFPRRSRCRAPFHRARADQEITAVGTQFDVRSGLDIRARYFDRRKKVRVSRRTFLASLEETAASQRRRLRLIPKCTDCQRTLGAGQRPAGH